MAPSEILSNRLLIEVFDGRRRRLTHPGDDAREVAPISGDGMCGEASLVREMTQEALDGLR
jgi:hypothetical protein